MNVYEKNKTLVLSIYIRDGNKNEPPPSKKNKQQKNLFAIYSDNIFLKSALIHRDGNWLAVAGVYILWIYFGIMFSSKCDLNNCGWW